MSNINKVINILNDCNHHDGNSIGKALSITRSAVWKIMKKLADLQVQVESIKGKGYRLKEPISLLDHSVVSKVCNEYGIKSVVLENVDSTNDYIKQFVGLKTPYIVTSEQQTRGKGRLERTWYSPFGQNLYLSLLHVVQKDVSELCGLSLVVSLAILKTCKYFISDFDILVKWPNDIVFDNKKLAGSLVEIQAESNGLTYIVIGIGLNVNMFYDNGNITQNWTSMRSICKRNIDKNDLCELLITNLHQYLNDFDDLNFSYFLEEWHESDSLLGKSIKLQNMQNTVEGTVEGVDGGGKIIIKSHNGTASYSSGDTYIIKEQF